MFKIVYYFLIFLNLNLYAQQKEAAIFSGLGFYDALNLGVTYPINKNFGIGGSLGFDKNIRNNEKYFTGNLEIITGILKNYNSSNGDTKLWIHNRIYYWTYEDRFYKFRVITYNPCVSYRTYLNPRLFLSFCAGPAVNFVVFNHRKTFDEVGWPHYVQFNPGFRINYILKK